MFQIRQDPRKAAKVSSQGRWGRARDLALCTLAARHLKVLLQPGRGGLTPKEGGAAHWPP
jgi:hypothetical protein